VKFIYKVSLFRALHAFLVSVLSHIVNYMFASLEFKQGAQDVAGECAGPSNTSSTMNKNISFILKHMLHSLLYHLLVPNIKIFRRCHLNNRILEKFNATSPAGLLVLLDVAADRADLNIGDQTDNKVYVQVFHCIDICLHISLIVFTIPS